MKDLKQTLKKIFQRVDDEYEEEIIKFKRNKDDNMLEYVRDLRADFNKAAEFYGNINVEAIAKYPKHLAELQDEFNRIKSHDDKEKVIAALGNLKERVNELYIRVCTLNNIGIEVLSSNEVYRLVNDIDWEVEILR